MLFARPRFLLGNCLTSAASLPGKLAAAASVAGLNFQTEAKPLIVEIKDAEGKVVARATMAPREFSTGSLGWNVSPASARE